MNFHRKRCVPDKLSLYVSQESTENPGKVIHSVRDASQDEVDTLGKAIELFQIVLMSTNTRKQIMDLVLNLAGFKTTPHNPSALRDYRVHFDELKMSKQALARIFALMSFVPEIKSWESEWMWSDYVERVGKMGLPSQTDYLSEKEIDPQEQPEEAEKVIFPKLSHYPTSNWLEDKALFEQFHHSIRETFDKYKIFDRIGTHTDVSGHDTC